MVNGETELGGSVFIDETVEIHDLVGYHSEGGQLDRVGVFGRLGVADFEQLQARLPRCEILAFVDVPEFEETVADTDTTEAYD